MYSQNGVINRAALKKAAREKISGNLWNLWKPLLVIGLVSFVAGMFLGLFGEESNAASILSLIVEIAALPMTAGLILYYLNFTRGKEFDIHDLFAYYDKRILNLVLLEIVIGLFTFLWSLLFIIPGIIAALSYSMSMYIFVDETKTDTMEIINESKRLTKGYKWDLVVFHLSFILWDMLVGLTFGIAAIYVVPYQTVAQTMYYDELKAIKE